MSLCDKQSRSPNRFNRSDLNKSMDTGGMQLKMATVDAKDMVKQRNKESCDKLPRFRLQCFGPGYISQSARDTCLC